MPTFAKIGEEALNIQDIQLDEDVGDYESNIQFLGSNRAKTAMYYWFAADSACDFDDWPEGKGAWVDTSTYEPPEDLVTLERGQAVQIDLPSDDAKPLYSGQVDDGDIVYDQTVEGFNYVGNAFPSEISIQDIQLDEDVGDYESNIQFLGSNRAKTAMYYWFAADSACDFDGYDGKPWPTGHGAWVDTSTYEPPEEDVKLPSGKAVQIDCPWDDVTITVLSPIEL